MALTNNQTKFIIEYTTQLEKAIMAYPDEYAYPISEVEIVVSRMAAAIERNSFNKDSRAIKATCKELGIKFTYAAIKEFWNAKEAA